VNFGVCALARTGDACGRWRVHRDTDCQRFALAGATAIYFMDFGLGTGVQLPGTTMVTAASAERAGASVVPTVRP
jgi:hypothetical protein